MEKVKLVEKKVTLYIDENFNTLIKSSSGKYVGLHHLGHVLDEDEIEIVEPDQMDWAIKVE